VSQEPSYPWDEFVHFDKQGNLQIMNLDLGPDVRRAAVGRKAEREPRRVRFRIYYTGQSLGPEPENKVNVMCPC
jgi:hypothetical protein